uniref:protein spire homolog 2-like n=1 Tax=Podarcis muralis TaxID=64176 RepID=UPI00109F9518|nr:protein spire homolog 2-like [Podarcis muralis]
MVVVRKPLNTMVHTKDFTKVLLAEVRRYYEQPLSEEQAWAICFQCCYKMKWMKAHGLDSALRMVILDIDNAYIHSDGTVSFTLQHLIVTQNNNPMIDWKIRN